MGVKTAEKVDWDWRDDDKGYVRPLRETGEPCADPQCPYNGAAYYRREHWAINKYGGLCLNCIDDFCRDEEFWCD